LASHHYSTIDDELPPDDDSASSLNINADSRCPPSEIDEDSDSLDERTLALCEFFKEQLHPAYSSNRASSICSDIQSEFDEDEHGSCASTLFRPYVAGSGSGFMDMSGTSMDYDDGEHDGASAGVLPPKKLPHQPMRRADGSVE
jgi:hypothetical protein